MGFLDQFRIKKKKVELPASEYDTEQAVIVSFNLLDEFGSKQERDRILKLEDQLERTLEKSGVGDCDGHDFGNSEAIFYMYGPKADKIYEVVKPILQSAPYKPLRVIIRYGGADDEKAKERRLVLS